MYCFKMKVVQYYIYSKTFVLPNEVWRLTAIWLIFIHASYMNTSYTYMNASTLNTLLIICCNQPVEHNIAHYYILLRGNLFAGNYFNCNRNTVFSFH